MIRYVKLVNYKSLVNFNVDFMKTKSTPKNLILIYGENGIGKSNLATSFYTLNETMRTMSSIETLKKLIENSRDDNVIENNFKDQFRDIKTIIKDYKTIDTGDNMVMEYGFTYEGKNGFYRIEMNNEEIVSEKLEYVLNKNQTYYFDINCDSIKINSNLFLDKTYYNQFSDLLDKYWGKHSFLSILSYEIEDKKNGYIKNKISNNLFNVLTYLKSICTKIKGENHNKFDVTYTKHNFMCNLVKGKILYNDEGELDKIEYLLNEIFTNLYSDIKNVYYKKDIEDNFIKYKLFVKKMVYEKIIDVDFELESSGTQNILELIPYLLESCQGSTVIIDELDTGIHDLLVKYLLENISRHIKGQLIITTHNTMLIESIIPKENIYVFNASFNAKKELISITEYNGRIHKNVNACKKYLSGLYGGIPLAVDIDFDELIDNLK